MAALSPVYTLATGGGTILFNNGDLDGTVDLFWIQTIQGLDDADLRTSVDPAPQTHGSLVHNTFSSGLAFGIEGVLIVRSTFFTSSQCEQKLNIMEDNLRTALRSIRQANGTLSWTISGVGAKSLAVRYAVKVDYQPTGDYSLRTFTFGLQSAADSY